MERGVYDQPECVARAGGEFDYGRRGHAEDVGMGRDGGKRASGWGLDGAGYSPLSAPAQLHEETRDLRPSGRAPDQMRPIAIETAFTIHAEGSLLVAFGNPQVLVPASVGETVPRILPGTGP